MVIGCILIFFCPSAVSRLSRFRFSRKRQRAPGIYAEKHHEHCLYGVYYKHEIQGVGIAHAVKYHHGLNCEMPRAGSVGCWHYNGYAAHHECYEGAIRSESGCEIKAEKRQIVMKEIAHPYPERVKHEQGYVLNASQRHYALPYSAERGFHLIIY